MGLVHDVYRYIARERSIMTPFAFLIKEVTCISTAVSRAVRIYSTVVLVKLSVLALRLDANDRLVAWPQGHRLRLHLKTCLGRC